MTIVCHSQIKFYTIPLGLSYDDFDSQLQAKRFIPDTAYNERSDTSFLYKGLLMTRNVDVMVSVTPGTKTVWKVDIYFPNVNSWQIVKNDFFEACSTMNKNYGTPKEQITSFTYPYRDGDGYELQAISKKKCIYQYHWEIRYGTVQVVIVSPNDNSAQVIISYVDKQASAIFEAEKGQNIKKEK